MSRYRLSRQADDDLDGLADHLGRQDPFWAVRVLEATKLSINRGIHAPFFC